MLIIISAMIKARNALQKRKLKFRGLFMFWNGFFRTEKQYHHHQDFCFHLWSHTTNPNQMVQKPHWAHMHQVYKQIMKARHQLLMPFAPQLVYTLDFSPKRWVDGIIAVWWCKDRLQTTSSKEMAGDKPSNDVGITRPL